MKKQIISIIMSLAMISSIIPCAASAEEPEIISYSTTFENSSYIFNVNLNNITDEGKLIAAAYHNGILTGISSETIEAGKTSKNITVPSADGDTADKIKLFIWDNLNNIRPQCQSITDYSRIELSARDFDDASSFHSDSALYFYPSGQREESVKYPLADSYTVYVNNKISQLSYDEIIEFISNGASYVTLQKDSVTDLAYNEIMINMYATAVVDEVVPKSPQLYIYFKNYSQGAGSRMTINPNDDNYSYSFKLNGEEIDPADLQPYDVLTIAYEYDNFAHSPFYEVIVSRDTVNSVKFTGENNDVYTFDNKQYKSSIYIEPSAGNDYILYLDCFGKISYITEDYSNKKYGILKDIYKKADENYYASVINKAGIEEEYQINEDNLSDYKQYLNNWTENGAEYDNSDESETSMLNLYPEQVITYNIDSSDMLTINNHLRKTYALNRIYNAPENKLSSNKLSESIIILDISNINNSNEIKVISPDNLIDGNRYSMTLYEQSDEDRTYQFALLTEGDVIDNESEETELYEGYGILDNIYKKANGNYYAYIITNNGNGLEYKLDKKYVNTANTEDNDKIYYTSYLNGWTDSTDGFIYNQPDDLTTAKLSRYPRQAIRYAVSSLNKITVKEFLTSDEIDGLYNEANGTLGAAAISDTTVILDISCADSKNTVKSISKNHLVDNNRYLFNVYGNSDANGTYPFIIIKEAPVTYNSDTQLAVFNSSEPVIYDGNEHMAYNVFINNERRQLIISNDYNAPQLNDGDPIVFNTNSSGEITDVKLLFKDANLLNGSSYKDIYIKAVTNHETLLADDIDEFTQNNLSDKYNTVQFKFGVLVNRSGNTITLGTIDKNGGVNYDTGIEMYINNMNTVIYNYAFPNYYQSSNIHLDDAIQSTPNVKSALSTNLSGQDILDLTHDDVMDSIVFALVRIKNDNEPQEIYMITNNN